MTNILRPPISGLLLSVTALLAAACQSASPDQFAVETVPVEDTTFLAPDYERAFSLRDSNLTSLVVNADPVPNWIGEGETFWIALQSGEGFKYEMIVSETGNRAPLFDHDVLASALSDHLGIEVSPSALPITLVSINLDAKELTGTSGAQMLSCSLKPGRCEVLESPEQRNPTRSYAPDGVTTAFVRDHNIWINRGDAQVEKALTDDGEEFYAYGKYPDASLMAIPLSQTGVNLAPFASFWSPDSAYFVTTRYDERDVEPYPFVAFAPGDGSVLPKLHQLRIPVVGDAATPQPETHFFDIRSGTSYAAVKTDGFTIQPGGLVGWNPAGDKAYMIATAPGLKSVRLIELSLEGERVVYEESREQGYVRFGPAIYNAPGVRLIKDGQELIWYSERSGWGHLYRINVETGEIVNAITQGEWTVFDIISVDDEGETIFFTAGGREQGRDPYYRHLYKVRFDGSDLTLLTPENADHHFPGAPSFFFRTLFGLPLPPERISPNGKYIAASYSTLDQPPKSVLRRVRAGEPITAISTADVSQLDEIGYRPPERFSAIAADGVTEIFGAIHLPDDFDPSKSYPVVNAIYAGPQVASAGIKYRDAFTGFGNTDRNALAALGFVVVTVDGRGTPYRSLEFQNFSRGDGHGNITLEDNRAAIEQLAASRPYIDLSRIGIAGHSWGGYHATRGLLLHNDFYRAAVSSAGIQGYEWSYPGGEVYVDILDFGEGRSVRNAPSEVPLSLSAVGNTQLVDRLKGHLLLAYGDLDENVRPVQTVQLIKALTSANKNYDLILMPNSTHYFNTDDYFVRRKFEYLVEHVMEYTPSTVSEAANEE